MDVAAYLQRFENSMSTFVGDDPLEQWDKFIELLMQKLPPDSTSQLSLVLNRLVETFLNVEKYASDERYVNYCVKYASTCADPLSLYNYIFSKGVGTHSAALYVFWAQQFEQKGMNDQAEAVYRKGFENQAQPTDSLLHEYRQFQSRTKHPVAASGSRNPLQNSNSANILTPREEPSIQNKESADCQPARPAEHRYVHMISRSEYSGKLPPSSNENLVPAYDKDALQCEGSELCFEEVRAQRYFQKIKEQQRRLLQQQEEEAANQKTIILDEDDTRADVNFLLKKLTMSLEALGEDSDQGPSPRPVVDSPLPVAHPRPSVLLNSWATLGSRLPPEPTFLSAAQMPSQPQPLMDSRASLSFPSHHAPVPSVPQYTPVLNTCISQHASVSAATISQPAPVSVPVFHNAPAQVADLSINTSVQSASISHPASVQSASISHPASVQSASISHPASVLSASISHPASVLSASISHPASVLSASISHPAPAPFAPVSHHSPVPAASMYHHAPVPAASMSHHAPVPSTSMSHHAPVLSTSMSHHAPVLSTSMSHHAPVLSTSMSHHAPVPSASMSHHAPILSTSMSHHAPVPSASMSHHAPILSTSMSHHAPVPSASMSHHESVLLQGPASDDCPPENGQKDNEYPLEPEHEANVSQGGTANLSRITPNNSLGYIQATPSRVLPSPTVNTREALDVIMDMFQAPTLLEEPFPNSSEEQHYDLIYTRNGPTVKPATAAPFTIFQDEAESENKENCSDKVKQIRVLTELPKPTKPNETPIELAPDESTMWGARFNAQNSLAACPNSTSDFAMLARFVSTPSAHKTPGSTANSFFPAQENGEGTEEEDFARRCTKKLSPIMEQSPSEEKANNTTVTRQSLGSRQGTIVGEALAMNTQFMTNSCTTMVQPPPPAVLSFRDQTLGPNTSSIHRSTGPAWDVYTSPEPKPKHEAFTVMEDGEEPASAPEPRLPQDIPMSPESAPRPDWFAIQSPEQCSEQDLDAFLTPHRPEAPHVSRLCQDVPMSPQVEFSTDAHMMSPDKDIRAPLDMSMNPKTPRRSTAGPAVATLVPDPWNDDLIAHLLASMDPPLMAHPHCVTWQCNLPNIAPKMTLSMGSASLRVDSVIGEGAFAKVYQATDPTTSDKMVLKVQKPANPWEFYINSQLDARVPPSMRHFYSSFHSAHLFNNGSVLLGEMHNYGTLLNAVNMYRTLGDKVMPQPLVMYFTVCVLHMIEQLHRVGIVHADVKPDNFLLGERFLENRGFDGDNLDHGLVLIDLGQSIDMRLFPEGTAFTAKCLTSGFQCTEMQTGKPWNYQTDYFGVAGTVYCMLFGSYMQVVNDGGVWRTNGVFRRNPHSDLWQEFFHTLLNVPDCSSLPDLTELRRKLLSVLEQNYRSKLASLKSRLVVLLLESSRKASRR